MRSIDEEVDDRQDGGMEEMEGSGSWMPDELTNVEMGEEVEADGDENKGGMEAHREAVEDQDDFQKDEEMEETVEPIYDEDLEMEEDQEVPEYSLAEEDQIVVESEQEEMDEELQEMEEEEEESSSEEEQSEEEEEEEEDEMTQFDLMSEDVEVQALRALALQDHEYFFFPLGLEEEEAFIEEPMVEEEEDGNEGETLYEYPPGYDHLLQPDINDVDHEEDADADYILDLVLDGGRGERATRRALLRS
uniref:Acidic leucine-rich nuclear phosphoprotein 32-related protein-like n=1 Tax=Caenorhabditis tropicalis TaxID=1561998 RepID=A0A1I7V3B6_9PELO